jgi:hypothetical protein
MNNALDWRTDARNACVASAALASRSARCLPRVALALARPG